MTQRWRYFTLSQKAGFLGVKWDHPDYADLDVDAGLDRAGRDGWELVSVFLQPMTGAATFIFKKPE
jgi:hypothetical protein